MLESLTDLQKVIHVPTNTIVTVVNPEGQMIGDKLIIPCADSDNNIEDYPITELLPLYTKDDVLEAIFDNVDIRGIELENYKSNFENSGLYERLCRMFNYPIIEAVVVEKTIPVTYAHIKATCGWNEFCDVTGGNHYAINEFGDYEDRHIFNITEEQFKKLF